MARLRWVLGCLLGCVVMLGGGGCPLFAADTVVFLRIAPTQSTLYVAHADGSGERALTGPKALDYNPAWSPKGDWIAFTSERAGSADLFRVHPDGTGLERLTDDPAYEDQAAWSPDEKRIVFVSTRGAGRANLWVLDVATRKAMALTSGAGGDFRPAWSPDGQWIAFSSDRGSELPPAKGRWERLQLADLYVMRPDGSGLRRVSDHGDFCGSPKWTVDSRSVVAYCMKAQDTWELRTGNMPEVAENQLFRIDVASGTRTAVTSGTGVKIGPAVLASGRVALMRCEPQKVTIVYGDGTAGPNGKDVSRRPASWSPDGAEVVYARESTTRPTEPVKLWSRNPKFSLQATAFLPAYDPTGEWLAVTKTGADGTSLYVMRGGKPAKAILVRKDLILGPSWSPDGRQLAVGVGGFTSFLDFAMGGRKPADPVNGGAQVAIVNADGTGFHVVTTGTNNNAFASFGPDGRQIVYRTAGPEEEGLRVMTLADGTVRTLTSAYDNFPVWSPKGDRIAFIRRTEGSFQAMTIHPDGTGLKQLTHTKGNEAHLAWSPDGERLLVTSSRMGFKDESLYTGSPQPYGEIFAMRADGSEVEQLTDDQWEEGGPAWQPGQGGVAARTIVGER
ncbi:MAG: hypothetical protein M3O02_03810 [Acidobacteriota bacterium]|nr:hypothetical protein [Acidobacteriota bacterium]